MTDKAGKWCEVSSTKIKILKLGIKYPDQKFATMTSNPQWHTASVSNVDIFGDLAKLKKGDVAYAD